MKSPQAYTNLNNWKTSFYDAFLTGSPLPFRLFNRLIWHESSSDDYMYWVLRRIPAQFTGKLLDVPSGTGVYTYKLYEAIPDADITCLDYASNMLKAFKKRFTGNPSWIKFVQGEVTQMPFPDEHFDMVISMNGFHTFDNKEKALTEVHRVLRKGGRFAACFYTPNVYRRTDFFVRNIMDRTGFFSPPHPPSDIWHEALTEYFEVRMFQRYRSFLCVLGIKK